VRARLLICLATAAMAAGALAGCGGGDDQAAAPGSPENPLVGQTQEPDVEGAARSNEAAAAGEGQGTTEEPGFEALVDQQSSKPRSRFSPCSLVSQPRARAILGAPVEQPVEAPQGPTCIYRTVDGEHFVTIAIQALDFRGQKRLMDDAQDLDVSSRSAYCGTIGQPMLNVRLPGSRVLTVGAPCEVAKDFAAIAVQRLPS